MSDTQDSPISEQPTEGVSLPSQASPQDTSNWDDRPFTTPGDRIVIETFQGDENGKVVAD